MHWLALLQPWPRLAPETTVLLLPSDGRRPQLSAQCWLLQACWVLQSRVQRRGLMSSSQ